MDPPVVVDGGPTERRVATVTWTGRLAPGTRVEFPLRVAVAAGTPGRA